MTQKNDNTIKLPLKWENEPGFPVALLARPQVWHHKPHHIILRLPESGVLAVQPKPQLVEP